MSLKDKYVRFAESPVRGTKVENHGYVQALKVNIHSGVIPVGNHIYEYKGTVVEEETFDDVSESIVVGKTYVAGCNIFVVKYKVEDGFIVESFTSKCLYFVTNNGVFPGKALPKLTLGVKKVSTGKKKVLKVL